MHYPTIFNHLWLGYFSFKSLFVVHTLYLILICLRINTCGYRWCCYSYHTIRIKATQISFSSGAWNRVPPLHWQPSIACSDTVTFDCKTFWIVEHNIFAYKKKKYIWLIIKLCARIHYSYSLNNVNHCWTLPCRLPKMKFIRFFLISIEIASFTSSGVLN